MTRGFLMLALFLLPLAAQPNPQLPPPPPAAKEQEPPEEDESLLPKEYALNPVQSGKEIVAGNFYFKKGNFRAASHRYLEATRWDPGSSEAFLKLGEAYERQHNFSGAREAYSKYLELASAPKDADALKKKMAKWPAPKSK